MTQIKGSVVERDLTIVPAYRYLLIACLLFTNAHSMVVEGVQFPSQDSAIVVRSILFELRRQELEKLLSRDDSDVNAIIPCLQEVPLKAACCHDQLSDYTKQLLRRGARVDAQEWLWSSLVQICVVNNQTETNLKKLARYAPRQGIRFSELITVKNYYGSTPLALALSYCSIDHVRFLLNHGGNINGMHEDKPVFTLFLKSWLQPDQTRTHDILDRMLAVVLVNKITSNNLNNGLNFIQEFVNSPKYQQAKLSLKAALRVVQHMQT